MDGKERIRKLNLMAKSMKEGTLVNVMKECRHCKKKKYLFEFESKDTICEECFEIHKAKSLEMFKNFCRYGKVSREKK